MAIRPPDPRGIDIGDQVVLAQAGFGQFDDAGMHGFNNAGGAAHIVNLAVGFDGALPVHQTGAIADPRLRHTRQ